MVAGIILDINISTNANTRDTKIEDKVGATITIGVLGLVVSLIYLLEHLKRLPSYPLS